ncbi:MAG TPA: c-type cytochrome domain-containing protein [Rhodocyclaceae bacterium]
MTRTARYARTATSAALLLAGLLGFGTTAGAATYADIAPILQVRCVMCHSGDNAPLGLKLDSLEALKSGSKNGPIAMASAPDDSELIRRLTGNKQPRMPMTGPPFLSDAEVAQFRDFVAAGMPAGSAAAAPAAAPTRPKSEFATYDDVAPIFARRCAKCHTDSGLMGPPPEGYRLTSHAATLATADRVRVVPGNPGASELLRRVRGDAYPRMPFDGPPWLAADEVALIERWIVQGARDSAGKTAAAPVGARLRLHGRLESGDRLDELPLAINRGTRIDKTPRPGDYVEVRATLGSDGAVLADRIRRR